MKRRSTVLMLMVTMMALCVALVGCGSRNSNGSNSTATSDSSKSQEKTDDTTTTNASTSNTSNGTSTATGSKSLVVYFSYTGNVDTMAHWIADEAGADLVRVTAKEAYPEDYNATVDRAKQEQDAGTHPAINVDLTAEQLAQYDTVYFGFPVWWYDIPMPMYTFLESYDLSGKTVVPFFSHGGSSSGANSLPTLEKLAKGATVRSSDAISILGDKVASSEQDVRTWVRGLSA